MAKYKMEDGTIVDTSKADKAWDEDTYWDGHNHISKATRSQWDHQTLYKSSKGRYYIVNESQWQGSTPSAEFVSDIEAATWLLENGEDLPEDLLVHADAIEE